MSQDIIDQFTRLFRSKKNPFGNWDPALAKKGESPHSTLKRELTDADVEGHLSGKKGIGLTPVTTDGTVWWCGLDIDVDTIDHKDLATRIKELGLPLYVFRSKSNAAHALMFLDGQGKQASVVRGKLKGYAQALGHDKCEIFPKQNMVLESETGSWLNMPYFGALQGDMQRCLIDADGKEYTIEEAFEHIQLFPADQPFPVPVMTAKFVMGPPCLQELVKDDPPAGTRNNGLYNYGVFFKKSNPDSWQDMLKDLNRNLKDPAPESEMKELLRSLSKKSYQYKCEEDPISSLCNRDECLKRKFGIRGAEDNSVSYSPIQIESLQKYEMDEPRWFLTVDGIMFDVDTATLMNYNKLRLLFFERLPGGPPAMKNEIWLKELYLAKRNCLTIEGPPEASASGQVLQKLDRWLSRLSVDSKSLERQTPYLDEDGKAYFSYPAFFEYLTSQRLTDLKSNAVASLLNHQGWTKVKKKFRGKKWDLMSKVWDGPKPVEHIEPIGDISPNGSSDNLPELIEDPVG